MTDSSSSPIFISLNDVDKEGHSRDIRAALQYALDGEPYEIFQDQPKKPENIFSATVESLLLCKAAILDASPVGNKIDPDILIQFGICCALRKKVAFLFVQNNSSGVGPSKLPFITSSLLFDSYLEIKWNLKGRIQEWLNQPQPQASEISHKEYNHSFTVFGVNQSQKNQADLCRTITNFVQNTDWEIIFDTVFGTKSIIERLLTLIVNCDFCVFCLKPQGNETMSFGMGLAIGSGVPFLILQPDKLSLPLTLQGYDGVISYGGFLELGDKLKQYAATFLSDQVQYWEGSTYFHLLARLEKQVSLVKQLEELDRIEQLLYAITKVFMVSLAKPYALLGDLYREKNYQFDPNNNEYLQIALKHYNHALEIDSDNKHCQDAIEAVKRHLQLIELLENGSYHSIPSLIRIIGEDLSAEHYEQVRWFLLRNVQALIDENDYIHSLVLLAAIQIHDQSEDVLNLVYKVIRKMTPENYLGALQDAQAYIGGLEDSKRELEGEKSNLADQLNEILKQLENHLAALADAQAYIGKLEDNKKELEEEKFNLANRLERISLQLAEAHEKQDKPAGTDSELDKKIDEVRKQFGYKIILVNFGVPAFGNSAWGVYFSFDKEPHVLRNGETLLAKEGLELLPGDHVTDGEGGIGVARLREGETFEE